MTKKVIDVDVNGKPHDTNGFKVHDRVPLNERYEVTRKQLLKENNSMLKRIHDLEADVFELQRQSFLTSEFGSALSLRIHYLEHPKDTK